jgi:hypothetical protein
MKLVTRNDIENWAQTALSKTDLPGLISKLVRATTPSNTEVNFPSGSTAFIGGWDGKVICQEKTAYIPDGCSLFEFGTEANPKGKAEKDYTKRKKDTLGHNPKDCVFIFITPRFWKFKDKWEKEKRAEGFWKDVRVYDSCNLEQWIELSAYATSWFADYLGKAPLDGIDIAEIYWNYWSEFKQIKILPETITSGRHREMEFIANFLNAEPDITFVRAASKTEATAFIIAAAKQFQKAQSDRFFSRAIVVHTEVAYKRVSTNFGSPLILLPTFENKLPMYSAVSNLHHVIVPLGADDDFAKETTKLPTIDRDGQIGALHKSGVPRNDAEKFSRESGRNITILKKLLGFPHNKTKWLEEEHIREIIPALLIGRWNETFEGDIELVENLSGQKYSDYEITLKKWKNLEESPVIQIGETWRLTSPLDLWTNLSTLLTKQDFQNLEECYGFAFKDGNPIIKSKEANSFAAHFNQKRKYSNWAREGLTQSLILVGRLGNNLKVGNYSQPQDWVDKIIADLLYDANGGFWISMDRELPLISEASPQSFINAVKNSLSKEEPEIMTLFNEEDGLLHKTSSHTGLLWALENLAWLPEYLRDVSLILLKLARLDPGGNLSNRPINSIAEIYKPWHYQTLASFEDRISILKNVTQIEPKTGWTLLIRLLPSAHGVAHPTHKMRWRMFDMNTNFNYIYQEIWDTHTEVIEILINLFNNDEKKFAQLINATTTVELSEKNRNRVLDWADDVRDEIEQNEFTAWETVRTILHRHRSHPDTNWALPESELSRLEELYYKLEPKDVIKKNIWLFNNHMPEFIEGFQYDKESENRHQKRQEKINEIRTTAVKNLIEELGLKETLELRKKVKEHWVLGDAMARINFNSEDILEICKTLSDESPVNRFIHNFLHRKSYLEGIEWIKLLFKDLQQVGYSDVELSNVLIPLDQTEELWNFLSTLKTEIQDEYWKKVYVHLYNIADEKKAYGLEKLLEYKRYFSAIDAAYRFPEVIETSLLMEILRKAGTEESIETPSYKGHEIERIFEELDKRDDTDKSKLIQLEWIYLPLLDSYGSHRSPKNLEEELTSNPEFFIDVLKWLYLPKDKTLIKKERDGISDEFAKSRAKQAYHLLNSWKKIPGMKENHSIDKKELRDWIEKVRELAKEVDRLEVADMEIGKMLAQYPENIPEWPNETIFQIIEDINSESLKNNYSSAMFNKRSFTSRGAFDGGNIEREKAEYFGNLAKEHRNKYPNTAQIFHNMSKSYLRDAKREDDSAERNRLEY